MGQSLLHLARVRMKQLYNVAEMAKTYPDDGAHASSTLFSVWRHIKI